MTTNCPECGHDWLTPGDGRLCGKPHCFCRTCAAASPQEDAAPPVDLRKRLELLVAEANHDAQMWGIEHHDQTRKIADMARYRTLKEVLEAALAPLVAVIPERKDE